MILQQLQWDNLRAVAVITKNPLAKYSIKVEPNLDFVFQPVAYLQLSLSAWQNPEMCCSVFAHLLAILNVAYEKCCIGRGLGAIHSKTGDSSFMLYTMFALKPQLDVFNGEGTVFGSINRDGLSNLPVNIPSAEESQSLRLLFGQWITSFGLIMRKSAAYNLSGIVSCPN